MRFAAKIAALLTARRPSRSAWRPPRPRPRPTSVAGMDVSGYQGNVDWGTAYANGARFAYVKATEGTSLHQPLLHPAVQRLVRRRHDPRRVPLRAPGQLLRRDPGELLRQPRRRLVRDGKTLPGALDIEYNPNGSTCYGLSASSMVSWISDFSNTYHALHRRLPDDLLDDRLVDDLHRQLVRVRRRPTRCGSRGTPRARARCRPAGATTRSGSTPTPAPSRVTRTSSTARTRSCSGSPAPADCSPAARCVRPLGPNPLRRRAPPQLLLAASSARPADAVREFPGELADGVGAAAVEQARTSAEPTITPSAKPATSAAWSPLETPRPTQTGMSGARRADPLDQGRRGVADAGARAGDPHGRRGVDEPAGRAARRPRSGRRTRTARPGRSGPARARRTPRSTRRPRPG